jgi:hypothetical protein
VCRSGVATDLSTGANEQPTRKEFEAFKVAVAAVFLGLERALREPNVRPLSVPELIAAVSREIGLSRAQAREIAGLLHVIEMVNRHFGDWDRKTISARTQAARDAARRRPPRWQG